VRLHVIVLLDYPIANQNILIFSRISASFAFLMIYSRPEGYFHLVETEYGLGQADGTRCFRTSSRVGRVTVMKTLAKFVKCESGATAIEYGLIAALIGVAIITVVTNAGNEIKATFTDVENGLKQRK
jgi:pilus assembly protein Flp/PilA